MSGHIFVAIEEEYLRKLSLIKNKYILEESSNNHKVSFEEIVSYFYKLGFKNFQFIINNNQFISIKKIKEIFSDIVLIVGGDICSWNEVNEYITMGADYIVIGRYFARHKQEIPVFIKKLGERLIISVDSYEGKLKSDPRINTMDYVIHLSRFNPKNVLFVDYSKILRSSGVNSDTIKEIRDHLPETKLWYAGGVRSNNDLIDLNKAGASRIIVGTYAYNNPKALKQL